MIDADEGRVIGAYLNCSERATSRNLVTVAAPVEKRLGLAYISLLLSQMQYTSE